MARTPLGSSTRPLSQCSKSKTRIPAVSLTVTSRDHRMHSSSSDQTWYSERQFLHRSKLVRCGCDSSTNLEDLTTTNRSFHNLQDHWCLLAHLTSQAAQALGRKGRRS